MDSMAKNFHHEDAKNTKRKHKLHVLLVFVMSVPKAQSGTIT